MKNLKNALYTGTGLSLLAIHNVTKALDVKSGAAGSTITKEGTLVATIEGWISALLTLLYIVAVVYGLWGGFNILTAGGDEEKVGKGKKILINAVIGLVVIFLVGLVVGFVIDLLNTNSVNG